MTPKTKERFGYLGKLNSAVREQFADATDLPSFLATAGQLTQEQRKLIVEQGLVLLEQNYAHLPLKRAMHAVDPVQRLKLLLQALEHAPAGEAMPEVEFHREMTDIFTTVRDLHTNYLLPAPFNGRSATLPFMIEEYFEGTPRQRKYLVSRITAGFTHPTFKVGVEVVYWNGTPIERAVLNNAQRYAGSNWEARHARGLQTLTSRVLMIAPPPDEEWVVVGYRTEAGELKELRVHWLVTGAGGSGAASTAEATAREATLGLDLEQDQIQQIRKVLFAPMVVVAEQKAVEKVQNGEAFEALESRLPDVFEAQPVETPDGVFGYLRIRTFNPQGPHRDDFVEEFIRLLAALPPQGLIIDVRGNGGGQITFGETILQTLTPRRIEPEPVQFLNTSLNLEICRRHGPGSPWTNLLPWQESMQLALQTGATFSGGFPISDPVACNEVGQKYFGPVVLITDALCYSTTDIFAAGFQDHEIGPILGTAGNTGAGGANVWTHQHLLNYVLPGPTSRYRALPNQAGMRVAIRRTLRVGKRAGTPVEDLGVISDERHYMSRADVLDKNKDLIEHAGRLLATRPARQLNVRVQAGTPVTITVTAVGMTRLDCYQGERPLQSVEVQGGQATLTISVEPAGQPLELRGYDGEQLVARYRPMEM